MSEKKKFSDLGLSPKTLEAITNKGFEEPTSIQEKTIPVMLKNNSNIIAQAQTGTGKTAAFGLPLLELVDSSKKYVQCVVLTPTRELAIQVSEEIMSLRSNKDLKVLPVYGGQSFSIQLRGLKKGSQIIVGTPGRVIDHLNRKTLKLDRLEHLILDEADEMLNMGFLEDMEEIMKHTPQEKRTLLFSATMPSRIKKLASSYMEDYELISVKKEQLTTNLTDQIYYEIRNSEKFEALTRIIDIEDDFYGIIFCRTKKDVDEIVSRMVERGYDAEAIHGDISQAQRERTLKKFRKKTVNILAATDVAARGIDVNNLTHVINYSLPHDPESYVHRIGRTGRAGNKGTAITFITPSEYRRLMFIQKKAKTNIKKASVPDVDEIIETRRKKIITDIEELISAGIEENYQELAKELSQKFSPEQLAAAMLKHSFSEDLDENNYGTIKEITKGGKRNERIEMVGKARLFVAMGKDDGMNKKSLVDFICESVSVPQNLLQDVQVMEKFSFVSVPFETAEEIVHFFNQGSGRPLISHAKKGKNESGRSGGKGRRRNSGGSKGGNRSFSRRKKSGK